MTPKENAQRIIDEYPKLIQPTEWLYELAQAYLALESRIQKLEAVAEAAREYAEYTQRDSSLRKALAELEQK